MSVPPAKQTAASRSSDRVPTHLGVFAKYWQAGVVKTRLAKSVGDGPTSRLYQVFVATTLNRFADVGDQRTLWVWPPDRWDEFAEAAHPAWQLAVQCPGDLGQRMRHFFRTTMAQQKRRVVLLGSDTPTLPVAHVELAFQLLETHSVVLGPSEDGGYYLVGASTAPPAIFGEVDWSTSRVWDQTLAKLEQSGATFASLPPWFDVDQRSDLERLGRELLLADPSEPSLSRLQQAVAETLREF
jgi:rSAM/selenodomain-associated transferase 1